MAYNIYSPELGEKAPKQSDGNVRLAHYGNHYFIDTNLTLAGRGITKTDRDNCYKVTVKAFEKLCQQYDFTSISYLD